MHALKKVSSTSSVRENLLSRREPPVYIHLKHTQSPTCVSLQFSPSERLLSCSFSSLSKLSARLHCPPFFFIQSVTHLKERELQSCLSVSLSAYLALSVSPFVRLFSPRATYSWACVMKCLGSRLNGS